MSRRAQLLFVGFLFLISACAEKPPVGPKKLTLSPVTFSDLPGFDLDHSADAIPALLRSCQVILKKTAVSVVPGTGVSYDQKPLCRELLQETPRDDASAKRFFETWFLPYAVSGKDSEVGLFTGYYEAELHGSLNQVGPYKTPLFGRPHDLITVDLGDFRSNWHGEHISGKVEGTKLKPYDDRAAIRKGSLANRADILLWVDDPADAFFLEVQGSGRVAMTDGTVKRLGYDGANGRAYVAIGKAMADQALIDKPVTMQKIRTYLKNHPERAETLMDLNPSYVFFRVLDEDGPLGAEGVALTPERSLAVDPSYLPYGLPLFLDTKDADGEILEKVLIAQDTGGAIKGPVRGDFFWGFGPKAESKAGSMQSQGRYFILLPKTSHE